MFKDLLGRYYTSGRANDSFLHYDTEEEAINGAKEEIQTGVRAEGARHKDEVRYVVKIVAKVEKDDPPVKVTRYRVDGE